MAALFARGPAPQRRPDHRRHRRGRRPRQTGRRRRDRAGQTVPPAGGHPRVPDRGRPAARPRSTSPTVPPGTRSWRPRSGPGSAPRWAGRCSRGVRPGPEGPAGAVLVHRPKLPVGDHRGRRVRPDVLPGQVGVRAVGDRPPAVAEQIRPPTTPPSPTSWAGWSGRPRYTRGGHARGAAARHHRPARRGVRPPRLPRRRPGPAHPRRGLATRSGPDPTDPGPVAGPGRPGAVQGHRRRVGAVQHPPRGRAAPPARGDVRSPAPTPTRPRPPANGPSGRSPASPEELSETLVAAAGARSTCAGAALAVAFQADHGRPPTPVEALKLAQQATLETRDAKHEPRSEAQQRATWRAEAAQVLGSPDRVDSSSGTSPRRAGRSAAPPPPAGAVAGAPGRRARRPGAGSGRGGPVDVAGVARPLRSGTAGARQRHPPVSSRGRRRAGRPDRAPGRCTRPGPSR